MALVDVCFRIGTTSPCTENDDSLIQAPYEDKFCVTVTYFEKTDVATLFEF